MSEHDEPRRKSGGCFRVLMWILAALVALIVVAVLIIWLNACTNGRHNAAEIARIKAAGEPVSIADLAPAPVPESDNGATDIEAAIALMPKLSKDDDAFLRGLSFFGDAPLSEADKARVRDITSAYRPALDRVRVGLAKPQFVYHLDFSTLQAYAPAPDTAALRAIGRALWREGNMAILDGRPNEAMLTAIDLFVLGGSLDSQPTTFVQVMNGGLRSMSRSLAQEVVTHTAASPALLRDLSGRCVAAPDRVRRSLSIALKGERASFITLSSELLQGNTDIISPLGSPPGPPMRQPITPWGTVILTYDRKVYLDLVRGWIAQMDDPKATLPTADWPTPEPSWRTILSSMSLIHASGVPAYYAGSTARARTAAIGLEVAARLAEGGSAPADLSSFAAALCTDPYSGKPLLVNSDDAVWTVYSVGRNGKDEAGVWKEPKYGKSFAPQPDDIAFTIPLKRAD